ncbi:MAG TPA: hypothetical protein VI197_04435 [Polyangiaceae bacterium]
MTPSSSCTTNTEAPYACDGTPDSKRSSHSSQADAAPEASMRMATPPSSRSARPSFATSSMWS